MSIATEVDGIVKAARRACDAKGLAALATQWRQRAANASELASKHARQSKDWAEKGEHLEVVAEEKMRDFYLEQSEMFNKGAAALEKVGE